MILLITSRDTNIAPWSHLVQLVLSDARILSLDGKRLLRAQGHHSCNASLEYKAPLLERLEEGWG